MKFTSILLSLFLLTILMIGAVSAEDSNSTDLNLETADLVSDEIELESSLIGEPVFENSDEDILEVSEDSQIMSDSSDFFDVSFSDEEIIFGSYEDDNIVIKVSLPKDSKGIVSIYENSRLYCQANLTNDDFPDEAHTEVSNDKFIYSQLVFINRIGYTKFTVKYDNGTDIFEKSKEYNFDYILGCWNTFYYGEKELRILAPHDGTGKMTVEIDGKRYTAYRDTIQADHDFKGYFIKLSSLLSVGKHSMKIIYTGDNKYPDRTVECSFEVVGNIEVPRLYDKNQKITIYLPSNAKGKLVVKVYNSKNKLIKTFSKKLVKGKAYVSFAESKFYGKNFKIVATYSGSDYDVLKGVVEDVDINPPISMPKKMLKGEKKYISINLPGKKGVLKVRVCVINKGIYKFKIYTKKLVKGKAKISLSKLKAGDYVEDIKFIETFKSGKKVTYYYLAPNIKILKPMSIVSSKYYYGKAKVKIQAYNSGGKALSGKYITIKINNKLVKKVKTNKKGVATFKLPSKYKPNTYKLTAQYKKNIVSKKIKILKA